MSKLTDHEIIASWKKNVQPWIAAVRHGEIENRVLITNKAVVNAILRREPNTVLDVGCGEGWLIRELARTGINALGIDIVPEFVEAAAKDGGGRFRVLSYEDVSLQALVEQFDVVVCNFSLLGETSVNHLFQQIPSLLNEHGALIIQTIHPVAGCGENHYEDGWREGSWSGFSDAFTDPAPWYFRTLETWKSLFLENGFRLVEQLEPVNPKTRTPASIIFIGEPAG